MLSPYVAPGIKGLVQKQILIDHIEKITEEKLSFFTKRNRKREYIYKKQIVIYFLLTKGNYKLLEIGKIFGLDHSTVIHTKKIVRERILNPSYPEYREFWDKLNSQYL